MMIIHTLKKMLLVGLAMMALGMAVLPAAQAAPKSGGTHTTSDSGQETHG